MDYPPEEKLWRRIQEMVVKRDEGPHVICDHNTCALWVVALDRFYCTNISCHMYTQKAIYILYLLLAMAIAEKNLHI